jgi:hypothetical protein
MANESMGGSPRNTLRNSPQAINPPEFTNAPNPFSSRAEMIVTQALNTATVPAKWLREMRPAAIVGQELFPSRKGRRQTWTIGAVLNVDRYTPTYRSWQSGMQVQRGPIAEGMAGTPHTSTQTQIG